MRAMVSTMPKAVPDHFENLSPTVPSIIGKADASPNPDNTMAMMIWALEVLNERLTQPNTAIIEEINSTRWAGNLCSKSPTENLPAVNTAENNVSMPSALDDDEVFTSIR